MSITSELLESGLPPEVHARLGYRAVTKAEARDLTGYALSGWAVPMKALDGTPYTHKGKPFYRLKPDPGQIQGDDPPRYLSPKDAGCRPYFSPLLNPSDANSRKPILLTEGEKKSDCLAYHGHFVIGLSGVDAWRDKRTGSSKPLPELGEPIHWEGRDVLICFDSDVTAKPTVRAALMRLCLWLIAEKRAKPKIVLIPPELDGTKNGVDDFIARHGIEAFEALVRIARPCGIPSASEPPCKQFCWEPEPMSTHHKALMAWAVFKDSMAVRPGFGLYRWNHDHWCEQPGKGSDPLKAPMHQWLDHLGFEQRTASVMGSILAEVMARLETQHWDPSNLLAFANGTLDVDSGAFTASHRREDRLTFCLPFPFDAGAKCPTWHAFLADRLDDPDLIQLLRASLRWTLAPKDRSLPFEHELAFDVHGPRRSGKGTLSEVLQAICGGRRGVGLIKSSSFSNPNALHALIGRRAAIDPDASGRISDPGVFNAVASNEPVEVKKLYQDTGADRLGVVIWRFFNDQPGASGGGLEGMGRRIVTFRFDKPVDSPDETLKARLLAEVPGIFWWAWSMPEAVMHETLRNRGQIAAIRDAAVDAALERDPVLRFLIERFPDGRDVISAADLYQEWGQWAREEGHEPGSNTSFSRRAKKVGAVQCLRSSLSRGYRIGPMRDFDVALHVGIRRLNPSESGEPVTMCHNLSSNLSSQGSSDCKGSDGVVTGMTGFFPNHQGGLENRESSQGERFPKKPVIPVIGGPDRSQGKGSGDDRLVTHGDRCDRFGVEPVTDATQAEIAGLIPLPLIGSGADAFDDGDDPFWGPRPAAG